MKKAFAGCLPIMLLAGFIDTGRANELSWDVTEVPPALTSPVMIDASSLTPTHTGGWRRFWIFGKSEPSINCDGLIYSVELEKNQDAIVYMSNKDVLPYPMHITGGNNVQVIGLQFELETQTGCDIGELANKPASRHPNANIHPRIPGSIALRLQQWGTSFVEGLGIDLLGHEADCIVSRNPNQLSNQEAQRQRNVIIQNTNCSGIEGLGKTDIGDGVHGDFFQNQGDDVLNKLVFENVSVRSSQEGIVLHNAPKEKLAGTTVLVIRRYDYAIDTRYVGDDNYESFGLAFAGRPGSDWTLEQIYIDDYRDGEDYLIVGDQRYGNSSGKTVQSHPEIYSGLPAETSFAPNESIGIHYVSPHATPVPR